MKHVPLLLIAVIYLAYISLGLPDGIFGVAWPGIRLDIKLPLEYAGIITTLLIICSATSSFFSGAVVQRIGTGKLILFSCFLTASALFGYSIMPSALWIFIFALPLGLGQGAVDSGLNHYVANNLSSRHMNWLHCCWGIGAATGPFVFSALTTAGKTWRSSYTVISVVQFILLIFFILTISLWKTEKRNKTESSRSETVKAYFKLFTTRAPLLAMLVFFVYTGLEFCAGLWANSMFIESRGIPKATAGTWIGMFYFSLTAMRFVSGFIVDRIGNKNMIRAGLILAACGISLLFFKTTPALSIAGMIITGAGFAPIYPCMMHETPKRVSKNMSHLLLGCEVASANFGVMLLTTGTGKFIAATSLELLIPIMLSFAIILIIASEALNRTVAASAE